MYCVVKFLLLDIDFLINHFWSITSFCEKPYSMSSVSEIVFIYLRRPHLDITGCSGIALQIKVVHGHLISQNEFNFQPLSFTPTVLDSVCIKWRNAGWHLLWTLKAQTSYIFRAATNTVSHSHSHYLFFYSCCYPLGIICWCQ
jgi:hypothetical protein